jgi:glutathione S-transferase
MENSPVLFYQEGTCSLGALISLIWLGKPFRICRIEGKDNENPDYLKINALGEVPTLYLDGTVVTENVAILQHIAYQDLNRKLTFRAGTPQFDQMNRALGFLTSDFHKAFFPIFVGGAFHPDKKVQEEIKKHVIEGRLREVWNHAEEHLLRTTFLFNQPMIADAYLFAMARWGEEYFDIETEFPNFARFQKAMNEDPAVKLALQIESGKQKQARGTLSHVDFSSFVKEAAERKEETDRVRGDGDFTNVRSFYAVNSDLPLV